MTVEAQAGEAAAAAMNGAAAGPWDGLLTQLHALRGEYLFFIGAAYLALLLLWHRRWLLASLSLGLGTLWLTFHLPVSLYLESLGADSFAETHNFDLQEARFWVRTLQEAVEPDFSIKKLVAYSGVALLSFVALRWLMHRRAATARLHTPAKLALALACMCLAVQQTTATALAFYLENTEKYQVTAHLFEQPAPALRPAATPVDLYVYIGESTSMMNMGLYGYPRPTTPRLSALAASDAHLVVFDQVLATHAHTSRSLLEALSFGLDAAEQYQPITERKRVSVVDALAQAGYAPRLISNQGQGGSWDQASSVIFKRSQNLFRSRVQTEGGAAAELPWDDAFFEAQLQALPPPGPQGRVVFLHSYAGHGPYHKNIPPEFRRRVDPQLTQMRREQVLADRAPSIEMVEEYDAAIAYVDHSVARTLLRTMQSSRPAVFVYFSDHGDAVYAGIGHDSARFRHEMARVPFLIYINEAAARARPGLLAKYQALARAHRPATLAQLPATLLDLLGAPLASGAAVLATPVVGERAALPPVMVRQTAEGITFVNLTGEAAPERGRQGLRLLDRTDEDTRRWRAALRAGASTAPCPSAPTLEARARDLMLLRCDPSADAAAGLVPATHKP